MSMYKSLLLLYPAAFYRRFAGEMSNDFEDGYAMARARGRQAAAAFLVRCYGDLFGSVISQWLRHERLIVSGVSVAVAVAIWSAAFYVAAHEWPNGPVTPWFIWQLGVALTTGSILTQGLLWINR